MGYMGLENWRQSDHAADLYGKAALALIQVLNDGIDEEANHINTNGPTNVALLIEGGILDKIEDYYIQDYFRYKDLIKGLVKHIEESASDKKELWNNEENRKMHHEAWQGMLKSVKRFLKKKEIV